MYDRGAAGFEGRRAGGREIPRGSSSVGRHVLKEVFLLRTNPIDLAGWRPAYYALVPINSALCALVLTALLFLKGNCYLNVVRFTSTLSLVELYLRESPIVFYFLLGLGGYLLLFLVGRFLSGGSFDRVVKRLILRSAPLLASLPLVIWYTDIPFSDRLICRTFHDQGVRSYYIVPPIVIYAGISLIIGLWNVVRVAGQEEFRCADRS